MKQDERLLALATRAGLEVQWTNAESTKCTVGVDTIRAVLKALNLPADNAGEIAECEERLRREAADVAPLAVAHAGEKVGIAAVGKVAVAFDEGGECLRLRLREGPGDRMTFRAPASPGYYRIEGGQRPFGLAVAPRRCFELRDIAPARRLVGLATQIYSLRGGTSGAFGDFAALGQLARDVGRCGIDALLASPTHALFGANTGCFSPYSPSTRMFLNPLFADTALEGVPGRSDSGETAAIDWASAGPAKNAALRDACARFRARGNARKFEIFCRQGGERLFDHALFESLDVHFRSLGIQGFRNWPLEVRSPRAAGIAAFARAHKQEIEYQLFVQWLADRSAAIAQKTARGEMAVGIVADIAVGMDPGGSHAWSASAELLSALHVGAPPDVFNAQGQDWGLTTLSPRALRRFGFASFIATLRANMRHAGGVRLDHAMGLRRLWVIPSGARPSDGIYLGYPTRDLLRLVALESHRFRAIVVGEDLGTVPAGFHGVLANAGILGMQVLWFERGRDGRFTSPGRWRRDALAMTTTHDLPTVAGWWSGHDLEQRGRGAMAKQVRAQRRRDRQELWSAFRRAGCATGPVPDSPDAAISAALAFVGRSRSKLAIASAEDIAGVRDQPNLPGTTNNHPNWRLRLPPGDLLGNKAARARLKTFVAARRAR